MDRNYLDIPDDADKLLFAEDLVSFISTDIFNRPYEGSRASPYRTFIHNAFNETVKVAIRDVTNRLRISKAPFFNLIQQVMQPDESNYLELVSNLQDHYSSEGFDAKDFLLYSCEVTITAFFFKNYGLETAFDMAVTSIFEFLRNYDMMSSGWDTLNLLASHLERMYTDSETLLTPESQSTSSADSGDEHESVNIHNLGERDSVPQNKEDSGTVVEKNKNEIQVMADSREILTVNKDMCTKNLEIPCPSTRTDLPQHSKILQVVIHDEKEHTKEMLVTDSTNDLPVTDDIISENLQVSSVSAGDETSQIVKTCQEILGKIQNTTNEYTKSKNEIKLSDEISSSTYVGTIDPDIWQKFLASDGDKLPFLDILDDLDSDTWQTSLTSIEDKVQLLDIFTERDSTCQKPVALKEDKLIPVNTSVEHLKTKLSEDGSEKKSTSESLELSKLTGPSSEPALQDD